MSGALAPFSAMELGGLAIAEAMRRSNVTSNQVDYVFMGHVLQAGQGQITARQAAFKAGIAMTVPATTVNKVCLSGLNAIYLADQMINAGEADIVVAGGMESMSRAPYLLPGARAGYRLGNGDLVDALMHDGLWDSFEDVAMGAGTEKYAQARPEITRARQDAFAARSHERAAVATKDGRFAAEIASVTVPARRPGTEPLVVESDEGVRPGTTAESLGALRAAFAPNGTITAGNASQISDGAAAVVVVSPDAAERLGVTPLGRIVGYGQVAGPDPSLLSQPSRATARALDRAGLTLADVDLFEFNEAFAAVALASMDDLGLPEDVVNVNGGAIALGHPIGMSGTRLALTVLHELGRRGGGQGVAALCGGGGQGDAIVLRTI